MADNPADTVIEHSALTCTDYVTGIYNTLWHDGQRPDVYTTNGLGINATAPYCQCLPICSMRSGVSGGMKFFNPNNPYFDTGVGDMNSSNKAWAAQTGNTTSPTMVFYEKSPADGMWFRNTCTYTGTHKWTCNFDELSGGTWYRDGVMYLN